MAALSQRLSRSQGAGHHGDVENQSLLPDKELKQNKLQSVWQGRGALEGFGRRPADLSRRQVVIVCVALLCFLGLWHRYRRSSSELLDTKPLGISGFLNTGQVGASHCSELRHHGQISIQPSFFVTDDLYDIARSLDDHPMVDYSNQDRSLGRELIVSKTWLRMAQSSTWLQKYSVYLTVTRVIFYDRGVPQWARISFLRGQIHDEYWNELKDYTIQWHGRYVTFPRIFDFEIPYEKSGCWYGPEDPRIIVDEEQDEPVILFNMVGNITTEKPERRDMFIYRPFSNELVRLHIPGVEHKYYEKNWMPFFYHSRNGSNDGTDVEQYIHFVYYFWPLHILKCGLSSGKCKLVFVQTKQDTIDAPSGDPDVVFRGGTNFVPIMSRRQEGIQHFVGLPRTRVNRVCKDGFYRPEIMVLTAVSADSFYIKFLSDPIELESNTTSEDICGDGRIVIANSIARWHYVPRQEDVMELSFSVDDQSTQVVRLSGVGRFIDSVMEFEQPTHKDHDTSEEGSKFSLAAQKVLGCAAEAAQ